MTDAKDWLDALIDEVTLFLECSTVRRGGQLNSVPLTYFDGVEPMFGEMERLEALRDADEPRIFAPPQEINPPEWAELPVDLRTMLDINHNLGWDERYRFQVSRVRRVTARDVRGRVRLLMPLMYNIAVAFIRVDGVAHSVTTNWGYTPHGWVNLSTLEREAFGEENDQQIRMAISMAITGDYEWRLTLRYPRGIGVSFATDQYGAAAAFRDREAPISGTRRAPLHHWVREHWRRRRQGAITIPAHLRGVTTFRWHDYECTLRPSPADLRRASAAKASRRP